MKILFLLILFGSIAKANNICFDKENYIKSTVILIENACKSSYKAQKKDNKIIDNYCKEYADEIELQLRRQIK